METKKLTCSDLMVGDYAMAKNEPIRIATPIGNETVLHQLTIYGYTSDGAKVGPFLETELSVIPLTAKILEKNFERDEYNDYSYYEINDEFCIRNAYDRIFLAQWIDSERSLLQYPNFIIDLKSVEQLQHALRLCGINDKEIVL